MYNIPDGFELRIYIKRPDGTIDETTWYDWVGVGYPIWVDSNSNIVKHNFIKPLLPIEKDGKLGFLDYRTKKVVLKCVYDPKSYLNGTSWIDECDGLHMVLSIEKKHGLIRLSDYKTVIPFEWDAIKLSKARGYLVPVCLNEKWGIYDISKGKLICEPFANSAEAAMA